MLSSPIFILAFFYFSLLIYHTNGIKPKIIKASFEIQSLNILATLNKKDNMEENVKLEPRTLQAIGMEVIYDQPIFAKFGYKDPVMRRNYGDSYAFHAFRQRKRTYRNLIEIHCFKNKRNIAKPNINKDSNLTKPIFSGYLLRCRDIHKYHSAYQFEIFDWPCERDKLEGTVRKNKLSGIVINSGDELLSNSDIDYCSLNYIENDPKSKVIVNFYGQAVSLPGYVIKRNNCQHAPTTLIVLPEYKGGIIPGNGAGIGVFPEMDLIHIDIKKKLQERKIREESLGRNQSAYLNEIAFAEEMESGSEGAEEPPPAAEEDKEGGEALDMLEKMLPPMVKNLFEWIMQMFDQKEPHDMAQQLDEDSINHVSNDFPYDEAEMLAEKVTTAASTTVAEALTTGVTEDVVMGVKAIIPVYLANGVVRNAEPVLHNAIHNILSESIPNAINQDIPTLVSRSLNIALAELLTRSVTHALVPTLSLALSHNNDQDYFCSACYYHHTHCNKCHYSPQMTYYNNYYSSYYSDFYSTYYGDYYTKGAQEVDGIEFK